MVLNNGSAVSGLFGGGHECLIADLPAALTGVWTCLSEKGEALPGQL